MRVDLAHWRGEIGVALALLATAAGFAWLSLDMDVGDFAMPGPGLFPLGLAALLALTALGVVAHAWLGRMAAADRVEHGAHDPQRIEAAVGPERLVLDRGRGVDQDGRHVVERDRLAPLPGVEARQLDGPGAIKYDRFGTELDAAQLARGRQSLAVDREKTDRNDQSDQADQREKAKNKRGNGDSRAAGRPFAAPGPRIVIARRPALPAALHLRPDSSIRQWNRALRKHHRCCAS